MKLITPRYELVRTRTSETEWLFSESDEAYAVTLRFNQILDEWRGTRGLTSELRRFLNRYPWHFDAMNHYASCKLNEGRRLDGFAFAQTAVALARSAFPAGFEEGKHCIPGGFVENRPFLRCLYHLMIAQASVNEFASATATGYEILSYDSQDRLGARLALPNRPLNSD